jgi:cytochrome b pre-mRNA-processing protein 3
MALTDNVEALAQAIGRNVLDGEQIDNARRLAVYTQAAIASLDRESDPGRLGVTWKFPMPLVEGAS